MPKVEHHCLCCGVLFFDYLSNKRKFCSHDCGRKMKYTPEVKKQLSESHKGQTPWNKGKKATKEARINQSCGRRGIKRNEFNGFVKSKDTLERERFRQQIQKTVFERDNYTCKMCGERGGKLQVDHIQPWAEYVELRFDINNCRTLCMACHYKITFNKELPDEIVWGHNLKLRGQAPERE